MLSEALPKEILSPRALTYRRNVLVVATVLCIIYWHPDIDFSKLTFFGIAPGGEEASKRAIVSTALWGLAAYNFAFLGYYAWRDFRVWWRECAEKPEGAKTQHMYYYPEVGMFFGRAPRREKNITFRTGDTCRLWRHEVDQKQRREWIPRLEKQQHPHHYILPGNQVKQFQERYLWFLCVDVGFPTAMVLGAVALMVLQALR